MCFWSNFCDIDYDTGRPAAFTATGWKTVSTVGAKSYRKTVAASYESLIMMKMQGKALVLCNDFLYV
jgi:hypothetical protein